MKSDLFDVIFFQRYLEEKTDLADSSIFTYTKSIERFLLTGPNLSNIDDYNNFLVVTTVKKRSLHYYSAIRKYIEYKFGIDTKATIDIFKKLRRPKVRKDIFRKRKYLTEEQIINVINYIDEAKHRMLALLQNLTGVRIGDLLRLKHGSIMPEVYKELPVIKLSLTGKGNKSYTVFLHDEIAQGLLMNYITKNYGHDDYYFLELSKAKGREGNPDNEPAFIRLNYQWYRNDLKEALNTAGVDKTNFSTHDMRRCFARRVWEKYKDVYILQQILNHEDPKTTLRYLKHSGLQTIDYHKDMQSK